MAKKEKESEVVADEPSVDEIVEEKEKSLDEIEQELIELKARKLREMPRCGHVNSHSVDIDNKPDKLSCEFHGGHSGNHSAIHTERTPGDFDTIIEREVWWSNAAGEGFVHPASAVVEPVPPPGWVAAKEPTRYTERK